MSDDLIDASALAELVDGAPSALVLLDVRWTIAGGADHAGYLAGHLPTARFVDLDADLADLAGPAGLAGLGGRHPLPDEADLERTWRRVGINSGDTVVVYDGGDGSAAVRAWWLLRWSGIADVRVLDGGLRGWPGPLATGGETPTRAGTVSVQGESMPTVDADGAAALADAGGLLDARAAARYAGEVEPIDPVAGHIPGALNLPYAQLYGSDGRLRPAAELRELFARAGVVAGRPVAASCGSGVTACHLILAGRVAGLDLALYPGSYSQWCALGRPVATGG